MRKGKSMDMEKRAVNAIRILAADAVQKANSGHPGMPLGAAPMAYELWARHMSHNPANPRWANRDRFVLSDGFAGAGASGVRPHSRRGGDDRTAGSRHGHGGGNGYGRGASGGDF